MKQAHEESFSSAADTFKKNKQAKTKQDKNTEQQQNFAVTETRTHSAPAAVQCYCCPELSERVLRCDWQVLASSCSYRSLLALLLLLLTPLLPLQCSSLITTDRGQTGLCLHQWKLSCQPVSVRGGGREQVK